MLGHMPEQSLSPADWVKDSSCYFSTSVLSAVPRALAQLALPTMPEDRRNAQHGDKTQNHTQKDIDHFISLVF